MYFRATDRMLKFQSTPPVKAATYKNERLRRRYEFQSTPPVKAATIIRGLRVKVLTISIHAAREGGDCTRFCQKNVPVISIHAAREGGDFSMPIASSIFRVFQSTPPVKAATVTITVCSSCFEYFNPRRP